MQVKRTALIVGGGTGQRMGNDVPKQFLLLNGRPVIFYTIEKFAKLTDRIVLVLPESQFSYWENLCHQHRFNLPVILVAGGETRTRSVMNGLRQAGDEGVVAIHDAVRPLVSEYMISAGLEMAASRGSAIPVIPARETLRIKQDNTTAPVNREDFLVVQTPQCFDLKLIMAAYNDFSNRQFTDDAGVFEMAGHPIFTFEGETTNIKITYKEDLAVAEALLRVMPAR